MSNADPLFFIAVIPQETVGSQIKTLKQEARRLFGSAHALRSPAHITLIPPFRSASDQIDEIKAMMHSICLEHDRFQIELNGFGHFRNEVIFVKPKANDQLQKLHRSCDQFAVSELGLKPKQGDFHPHLTIAFRDLAAERFESAWNHFSQQDFEAAFECRGLSLLRLEADGWHPIHFQTFSK